MTRHDSERLGNLGRKELVTLCVRQERIIAALLRESKRQEGRYADETRRLSDQVADYRVRIRRLGGKLPGRPPETKSPAIPLDSGIAAR